MAARPIPPVPPAAKNFSADVNRSFSDLRSIIKETTAKYLAFIVLALLFLLISYHYAAMTWTYTDRLERIDKAFSTLLPVLSGLAGSVTGYYFGSKKPET
jgi:hypothetical protein